MATLINSATVSANADWDFQDSLTLGNSRNANSRNPKATFTDGTADNQIKAVYAAQLTVGPSNTQDVDLAGALKDFFGGNLDFTTIKALHIELPNGASQASHVLVGGHPSAAFSDWLGDPTDTVKVRKGGWLQLAAPLTGYTVTATTADILRFTNGDAANSATVNLVLFGTK